MIGKVNLTVQRIQDLKYRRQVKPKKGGKGKGPLSDDARVANYLKQNGHNKLTGRQQRQIGRMGFAQLVREAAQEAA